MFGKREVKQDKGKTITVSQLSRQLEESLGKPNNPFLEYSKYDGEVSLKTMNYKRYPQTVVYLVNVVALRK